MASCKAETHTAACAPICVAISEAMLQWLARFQNEMIHVPGKERVTIAEHRNILNCIAAHDQDQAAQAMESHLKRASELYRMPESGGQPDGGQV